MANINQGSGYIHMMGQRNTRHCGGGGQACLEMIVMAKSHQDQRWHIKSF